jgi:hypothetical protein
MFSATNAAFEGLRLAGRHPFLMLFWAVAYVLAILVLVAMAFFIVAPPGVWPALLAGNPDGIEADAFSPLRFAVVFPLAFGAVLLTTAMVNTAVYRAVLRPRERGLGYLAIGGDEGRQVLLSLLIMLVAILVGAGLVGLTMVVIALAAIFSGVPTRRSRRRRRRPRGRRSTIQSAVLMTSRLCSMTTTVLPLSTSS